MVIAIRKISFAINEYYHVYNRGNDKRVIFHDDEDHKRFMMLLYVCNTHKKVETREITGNIFLFDRGPQLVAIGAYCLMPNHFHILLTPLEDNGVSRFMQKVTTAYSMYYNKKYKRTGALFEGKFKSQHTDTDRYLKYLFSYIHLNPLKIIKKDWKETLIHKTNQAITFLDGYIYSSYFEYKGSVRIEKEIIKKSVFPLYFPSPSSFDKELFSWITYRQ